MDRNRKCSTANSEAVNRRLNEAVTAGRAKSSATLKVSNANVRERAKVRPVVVSYNGNNGNAGEPSGNWCPSTGGASARARGYHPRKVFEIVYAKLCNLVHFGVKMVCNAVHNVFLNTLTMETAFPRAPLRNDPWVRRCAAAEDLVYQDGNVKPDAYESRFQRRMVATSLLIDCKVASSGSRDTC